MPLLNRHYPGWPPEPEPDITLSNTFCPARDVAGLGNLPLDIYFIIFREAANNSINDALSLSETSRYLYANFRHIGRSLLREYAHETTRKYLERALHLATAHYWAFCEHRLTRSSPALYHGARRIHALVVMFAKGMVVYYESLQAEALRYRREDIPSYREPVVDVYSLDPRFQTKEDTSEESRQQAAEDIWTTAIYSYALYGLPSREEDEKIDNRRRQSPTIAALCQLDILIDHILEHFGIKDHIFRALDFHGGAFPYDFSEPKRIEARQNIFYRVKFRLTDPPPPGHGWTILARMMGVWGKDSKSLCMKQIAKMDISEVEEISRKVREDWTTAGEGGTSAYGIECHWRVTEAFHKLDIYRLCETQKPQRLRRPRHLPTEQIR